LKKELIRLSKVISHAGICSRREAEKKIKNGEIKINGCVYKSFTINKHDLDQVSINGKVLKKQSTRLWCFYKPIGYVSSTREQLKQKSFFRLIPKEFPRVVSVGRLDINSEGLILLTNNPTLSSFLEKPKNKIERIYEVDTVGKIFQNLEEKLRNGIIIDGIIYDKIDLKFLVKKNNRNLLEMKLTEGKNREIRKIMKNFSLTIKKLKRIKYGPLALGSLKPGETKEITKKNIFSFFKFVNFKDENNFWQI